MLVVTITINGVSTVIESAAIKSKYSVEEKISVGVSKLIAEAYDIELDNTSRTTYDGRYSESIFYVSGNNDWYNADITIYDDATRQYVFTGRLKNIETNDKDNTVTLSAANVVREMADTVCVVSDTTGTLTPAGIVYAILTDPSGLGISYDQIRTFDFQQAISYQEQNSLFVRINYTKTHNVKCINVINELLNISLCSLASINNTIGLYQWRPWTDENGQVIDQSIMMPGTFSQDYDDNDIVNNYTIEYYSAGSIATATGSDEDSIVKYGDRPLVIPSSSISAKSVDNYRILLQSASAAAFVGSAHIARYKERILTCSLTVTEEARNLVHVNSDIFLTYDRYLAEPIKITEYKAGTTGLIQLKGIFLNKPFGISRVVSAPDAPMLYAAYGIGGGVCRVFMFTVSSAAGYKIYLNSGSSSVIIDKKIAHSSEMVYFDLPVEPLVSYTIQMSCYSKQLVDSGKSNPITAITHSMADISNRYRTKGDFTTGISLDIGNTAGGTLPADVVSAYGRYGGFKYGRNAYQPCAVFESEVIGLGNGRAVAICSGDIDVSYREFNGTAWGEWGKSVRGEPFIPVLSDSGLVQVRAVFHSRSWTSGDFCKIERA